jgi:hypothetical protein
VRSFRCPPINRPISVAEVIMPKPASWNSASTSTCPSRPQWLPVSTTTRPVTQTADVAMNSAVSQGAPSRLAVAQDSISSPVPSRIVPRNASAGTAAGWMESGASWGGWVSGLRVERGLKPGGAGQAARSVVALRSCMTPSRLSASASGETALAHGSG